MRVHFTNLFGQSPRSVALIAQNDTMKIAKELGANELAIYFYDNSQESSGELNSRLDGIVAGVSYGDIVFFQSPSWNSVAWDTSLLHKFRAVQTKLVMFIHDVPPIMFPSNYYLMPNYIEMYNLCDVVVVPSEQMRDRLIEEGLTVEKIIIQELWDLPHSLDLHKPSFQKKLIFAGNPARFPHILNWQQETPLLGASENQDVRVAASKSKNSSGLVYDSSAALDSQVIYEGFSNFQDFVQDPSQYTNKKIAENANLFKKWGITSFEFAPQYVSSDDGTFLDSVIQNGYAFSDRYDIGMSKDNKYGSLADLKAALKSLHAVGISAIADWVPDQIYNLPGDEVVTATRVNNYGETKDGAIIDHSLYVAKTRTFGNDYQGKYGGAYLDELKRLYPQIFDRIQISTGKRLTTDEKITKWSAKYMNGTNILDRGSEYVLKNGLSGYYGTNGGKVSLPKVVGSNQSTNNNNQNGDGSGKFEKSWGSVYYRYNDGKRARNAFIKDNDGNVYYFDNSGRMAIGEKTIDGKQYFFLANGVQLRDGYRQNRRGQVFYYDQNGVMSETGKPSPKPEPKPDNNTSGRNQFVQIGNNVWAYYDGNGKRVTGRQNINGQELFFDNNGVQVKGRTAQVDGVTRYFDANSGEMARNRFAEVEPGVWAYFNNDGDAVTGSQNINGQTLYFDQNGHQVKGALVNVDGNLRYYDANSGDLYRNRFQEVNGSWYYFDGNGNAVKGMVNINGQNLLFDNDGKQIKGHLVRVNGVIRYYDPNSGEMAVNRWIEISSGWWVYFDGEGRGQI